LRKVDAFEFFMEKVDWPTNATLRPPMAPIMPWGPVIDGSNQGLPKRPLDMIQEGNYAAVPLIIGTNKDEVRALWLAARHAAD
jgi:para-nitrobenzyl esterase